MANPLDETSARDPEKIAAGFLKAPAGRRPPAGCFTAMRFVDGSGSVRNRTGRAGWDVADFGRKS
jgi:hypothetical protein